MKSRHNSTENKIIKSSAFVTINQVRLMDITRYDLKCDKTRVPSNVIPE